MIIRVSWIVPGVAVSSFCGTLTVGSGFLMITETSGKGDKTIRIPWAAVLMVSEEE